MKQTILTIIISIVTTLVAFNYLSKESGDKLVDVATEVLQVQEEQVASGVDADVVDVVIVDVEDPTVETGSVATGDVATGSESQSQSGINYNPTGYAHTTGSFLLIE